MPTILGQDVKRAYWVAEATFGTTPASALSYLGETLDLSSSPNFNPEEDQIQNRAFTDVYFGPYEVNFSLTAKVRLASGGWDPVNFWALYPLGATNGRASDGLIDSFSLVTKVSGASYTKYALWNGCKVEAFQLQAPGVGKTLLWQADCRCQYAEQSTSKTFAALQSVTVGADPTVPTTDFARWDGTALQVNWGAGLVTLPGVIDWKMGIRNGLSPEFYKRTGNDTAAYPVPEYLSEGEFECIVELNRWLRDGDVLAQKLARNKAITLALPVAGKTWTLSGGYFPETRWHDMKQGKDPLKESLKLKFNGVAIA